MKVIKLEEVEEVLNRFIEARKGKNCQKTVIIERKAFEYALSVVQKCKVYDIKDL